jgi:hypothetical protein
MISLRQRDSSVLQKEEILPAVDFVSRMDRSSTSKLFTSFSEIGTYGATVIAGSIMCISSRFFWRERGQSFHREYPNGPVSDSMRLSGGEILVVSTEGSTACGTLTTKRTASCRAEYCSAFIFMD